MFRRHFIDHPASVGESYLQHMAQALTFAGHMAVGAAACLLHAFLPFLCTKSGSARIRLLHDRMIENRHRGAAPRAPDTGRVAAAD